MGRYKNDPEEGQARACGLHHVDGGNDQTHGLQPGRGHPREELVRLALNRGNCDLVTSAF